MAVQALIEKLRAVMPEESTVDINRQAVLVAETILKARATADEREMGAATAR